MKKTRVRSGVESLPEYSVWQHIKQRCLNPKDARFSAYMGRGITVCESWAKSFHGFYSDMGPRPSKDHSIERVNNDDGYHKSNCVWATRVEQQNNLRTTIRVVFEGSAQPVSVVARKLGYNAGAMRERVRAGWPIEDIINIPTGRPNSHLRSSAKR